jgi:hypothetical protein
MDPNCAICGGDGWVCEVHTNKAWKGGEGDCGDGKCCGAPGQLCACNAPDSAEDSAMPDSAAPSDSPEPEGQSADG